MHQIKCNLFIFTLIFTCVSATGIASETNKWIDIETLLVPSEQGTRNIPARFGNGYELDGQSGRLNIPKGLAVTGNFSFECWIKPYDQRERATIFSAGAWANFQLSLQDGQRITFQTYCKDTKKVKYTGYYNFTPNRWHHIVVTFDQKLGSCIYVNKQLVARTPLEKELSSPLSSIRTFGVWLINGDSEYKQFFHGIIDRPLICYEAIDQYQVAQRFEKGRKSLPVIPMPQQITLLDQADFDLQRLRTINLDSQLLSSDDPVLINLQKQIQQATGQSPQVNVFTNSIAQDSQLTIVHTDHLKRLTSDFTHILSQAPGDEGYQIQINSGHILIVASTPRGSAYALQTLLQLSERSSTLQTMHIWDYPTKPFRCAMTVIDTQPPMKLTDKLRNMIHEMAKYKYNALMIRTHDWVVMDDPEVEKVMIELRDYAARYHMDIVPYIQCYSHAKGFLWRDLRTGQTLTIEKEAITLSGQTPSQLSKPNLIITDRTPVIVTDQHGNAYVPNKDYQIIEGQTKAQWKGRKRYAWAAPHIPEDNAPYQIQRLANGNISDGQTVYVTYDIAAGQETTNVLSPYTWSILKQNMEKIVEIFNPDWINLGMDEIWVINDKRGRMGQTDLSSEQIVCLAFNKGYEIAQQVKPGMKVMLWSDMLDDRQTPDWHHPLDMSELDSLLKNNAINKNVYMMPWYYSRERSSSMAGSSIRFTDYGFNLLPASGHDPINNYMWISQTIPVIKANTNTMPGLLYTVWSARKSALQLLGLPAHSLCSWSTDQIYFPALLELDMRLSALNLIHQTDVQSTPTTSQIKLASASTIAELRSLAEAARMQLNQVDQESLMQLNEPGFQRLIANLNLFSQIELDSTSLSNASIQDN